MESFASRPPGGGKAGGKIAKLHQKGAKFALFGRFFAKNGTKTGASVYCFDTRKILQTTYYQ
jgi:hypothetical protein